MAAAGREPRDGSRPRRSIECVVDCVVARAVLLAARVVIASSRALCCSLLASSRAPVVASAGLLAARVVAPIPICICRFHS